jgi:hypothetical protein
MRFFTYTLEREREEILYVLCRERRPCRDSTRKEGLVLAARPAVLPGLEACRHTIFMTGQ